MHIETDRLEHYANGSLDVPARREIARHISGCATCATRAAKEMARLSAASTALMGRHLDAAEVEALAVGNSGGMEAEQHLVVCTTCRAEVDDLARFARAIDQPPQARPAPSRIPELLELPQEDRRKTVMDTTWSLEELREMSAAMTASETAGPAGHHAAAELLSLMCDRAEDGVPPAILTALKLQSLYTIAFVVLSCGSDSVAKIALEGAEELAHGLPNADHYRIRLDIAEVFLQGEIGSRDVYRAEIADLRRAEDIALSFGDRRLYFLIEHYRGTYHYANGRYGIAAKAFLAAARSPLPWQRQSAFYSASVAFFRLGDIDRAEEYLRRSQEERIDPPYAAILPRFVWQHGLIAMGRGRYAEACRLLREAIDALAAVAGNDAIFVYIDLAEAHVLAGEYAEAIEAAKHAISHFARLPPSLPLSQAIAILEEAFASREVGAIRASLEEARIAAQTWQASRPGSLAIS